MVGENRRAALFRGEIEPAGVGAPGPLVSGINIDRGKGHTCDQKGQGKRHKQCREPSIDTLLSCSLQNGLVADEPARWLTGQLLGLVNFTPNERQRSGAG